MGACQVCGGSVRFGKTTLTAHASDLGSGLAVLDLIMEHTEGRDQENVGRLLREGAEMGGAMHAYAHGREGGMIPSRTELVSWQRSVNMMAQGFSQAAPQEWSNFVAGIADAKARRLVQSMLTGPTG